MLHLKTKEEEEEEKEFTKCNYLVKLTPAKLKEFKSLIVSVRQTKVKGWILPTSLSPVMELAVPVLPVMWQKVREKIFNTKSKRKKKLLRNFFHFFRV